MRKFEEQFCTMYPFNVFAEQFVIKMQLKELGIDLDKICVRRVDWVDVEAIKKRMKK